MAARDLRVVPRPRRAETHEERVRFETPLTIDSTEETAAVASLLEELLERETNGAVTRADDDAKPDVRLRLESGPSDRFDDPEGYVLEAGVGDGAGVTISAASADGLRHGSQTFVTALSADAADADAGSDARWSLPACEIHDWPETAWRGFMLDPARGHLPVEDVKRRIDQAARAKYNRLHLHLLDDEGYALESAAYPELNRDADGTERPAYSPADVEELVAYANRRGIRVLPEVDVPAHATHLLERYPELRCTVADGEPADRVICIGRPETYEFVETLYAEVLELFPFEYVHVGGDEWEMHGHSWDDCVDCRERMAEESSESVRGHFYSFVRHLHGFLAERDRRTIAWNDQIDISESPDLPRDILIQFWRVAAPGRGPVEGVSMERFLEEGFDVLNSYVHAAYVRGWITEEYMLGWAPRRRPAVPEERASQVRGGELLAWEPSSEKRRAYFERALPSAIPVFADRLWNPEPHDRPAFSRAVTRHALGPFLPAGFDIYRDFGGLIAPTNWRRSGKEPWAHANASLGDRTPAAARAAYEERLETMAAVRERDGFVYPETADAYLAVLEWLCEVADREGRGVIDRP